MATGNTYGVGEGRALAAGVTAGVGSTRLVSGVTINVPVDVTFFAVNPYFRSGAAAAGLALTYRFAGTLHSGATENTNFQVTRCVANTAGYNKGPIDHLPVKGLRTIRLVQLVNGTGLALTQVNVEYRFAR